MFGTIRKHQKWLWLVIITLTIISFVIFFSPYSRTNGERRGSAYYGSINGEVITRSQMENAARDVRLLYFFMSGHWPDDPEAKASNSEIERETYQWLLELQEQKRLGIQVSSDTAAEVGRQMLAPFFKGGPVMPGLFAQRVLYPKGLDMADLERFTRHYLGHEELMNTIGLSGRLMTPQDAIEAYVREHQELAVDAVFLSISNYLASIPASTPEALSQFYTNQLPNYRIPDRVQVSYVRFGVSNYLGEAQKELTNLTEMVKYNLEQLGTNYTQYGKTAEEAKVKIREDLLHRRALYDASQRASEFAAPFFGLETNRADDLDKYARTNGLTVNVSAPLDDKEPPPGLEVGADFVKTAFARTADEPFAGPIIGQDGAYIIALYKKLPSEVPPLSQIRERVAGDYRYVQAVIKARAMGEAAAVTLSNSVAQGKPFTTACADAHLRPVSLPPFSLTTQRLPEAEVHVNLNGRGSLKELAFSTQPGKVSEFLPTREGGVIVYVKSKLPIDEARMQADLPAFTREERHRRQMEAFNLWFSREVQKGLRDTPLFAPKQTPPSLTGGPRAKS
jgi:hypothetical protein